MPRRVTTCFLEVFRRSADAKDIREGFGGRLDSVRSPSAISLPFLSRKDPDEDGLVLIETEGREGRKSWYRVGRLRLVAHLEVN